MSILKIFTISFLALLSLEINAQWRIGLTGGADINFHMTDIQYDGVFKAPKIGGTLGFMGQYNFSRIIGVRADFEWLQKNYHSYQHGTLSSTGYYSYNDYIQLPISVVVYPFRRRTTNLWANAGVYGAYCLSNKVKANGTINNSEDRSPDYRRRAEFGLSAGIGFDYTINKHFTAMLELRYYYSVTSSKKSYHGINEPTHDMTLLLRPSICYVF